MATPITGARPPKFIPALGVAQIVALASVPGRLVPSGFGPSEVVFDLCDGRPWYVPQVIADQIYAAGIEARQPIEVMATGKKKTELSIMPVQQRMPISRDRDYSPELERSIANAERQRAPRENGTAPQERTAAPAQTTPVQRNGTTANAASTKLMACFLAAIDAVGEAQTYATRKGLGITFSSENVTSAALSCYINECRNGGGR